MDRAKIGREGEAIAEDFYRSKGFHILARNLRVGAGEIDLIVTKGQTVHVVEVRTRTFSAAHSELLSKRKCKSFIATARTFWATDFRAWSYDSIRLEIAYVTGGRVVEVFEV